MEIVDVGHHDAPAGPLRWWRDAVDSVGGPDYAHVVMRCLAEAVQADVWSLLRLNDGAPEAVEMAMGRHGEGPWRDSGLQFVRLYGPFDPMRPLPPAALDEAWQVGLIESRDIHHPAYRACCYDSFRLNRRLSTRIRCASGDFQLNAYGFEDGGFSFEANAIAGFIGVATVLAASVDRHLREGTVADREGAAGAVTPAEAQQHLLRLGRPLSHREIEVLSLAVCGRSVVDSAAALGLSVTSVSTYRRRGLAKLDVDNAKQLLQVLLGHAMGK